METTESRRAEIATKRLEVTNLIYDFISDTALMPELIDGLAGLDEIDPDASQVLNKLDQAAQLAERLHDATDVDITRDIGMLVVGLNSRNRISHVPPGGDEWLGKKFSPSSQGIGWLNDQEGRRTLAHFINFGAVNHLPIHPTLIEGLKRQSVKTLIVIYRFVLSDITLTALQELYGLTPAELRLCESLGQGLSLKEAAEQSGTGHETNRTHLKNIFSKMGINRQTELVRTVTQISAAASVYDASRRSELNTLPDQSNSIRRTHTAFFRTRTNKRICYSVYGDPDGEPYLFFHHSLGCRILPEDMIQDAKRAGVLLYTIDRPGYGDSDRFEILGANALAECIEDFLDSQGLTKVNAIALAISGRLVMEALPRLKSRISRLDMFSFRGDQPPHDPTNIWNHFIYLLIKNSRHVGPMVRLLKAAFSRDTVVKNMQSAYGSSQADRIFINDPEKCFYILNIMQLACKQLGTGPSFEFVNLKTPMRLTAEDVAGVPINAYFADEDKYNPFKDGAPLLSGFPNAKCHKLENAGQLFVFSQFYKFIQIIRANHEA